MKPSNSRPKKSPLSKARKVGRVTPCAPLGRTRARLLAGGGAHGVTRPTNLRHEHRAWLHTELPTQLERDTSLTPEWVAESVVWEVERFLKADLPANFVERLAAKAYYCYERHRQFHKLLNGAGNRGREALFMFMRHWTAAWLKREHYALHKKLPWSFGNGQRLPL
ncbi:MAG: hypothetical protein PHY43_07495 [Verrucomicrobiales bacterium]|nr:hypothetical protein [Verrucomicrobiales bacterium]